MEMRSEGEREPRFEIGDAGGVREKGRERERENISKKKN